MRLPLSRPSSGTLHPSHIAEVIETSTAEFTAQCLEPRDLSLPVMPAFGSWVKSTDDELANPITIYGVIFHATTVPVDSVHRARALGLSTAELREQQPQIFAMLKTEIRVALLGFRADSKVYQHLPSRPPQIHQAIYTCDDSEVTQFTQEFHFLRSLVQLSSAPVDQLLSAIIRDVYRSRQYERNWLVQAGRQLSILLKDDYERLGAILSQIHP